MRRVHLPNLRPGLQIADAAQARHLRMVLRLGPGDRVEAFDAAGRTAVATVRCVEPDVQLDVGPVTAAPLSDLGLTVAAAVPKGDRADWMVEKLSEVGVSRFVPLRTARSVVHPDGRGKTERWQRIAVEAAKQSRRSGVLAIDPLADLAAVSRAVEPTATVYFCTRPDAAPLPHALAAGSVHRRVTTLLIGPEGGWTAEEEATFADRGLTAASLGRTILRIETAAVLAAGLVLLLGGSAAPALPLAALPEPLP